MSVGLQAAPAGEPAGADPRERLVAAMTAVAATHGYEEASVARVTAAAGASRATFYEHFSNREDCFLAAYRATARDLFSSLRRNLTATSAAQLPDELVDLLLDRLVADPAGLRVLFVESLAVPGVRSEHAVLLAALERFAARLLDNQELDQGALQIPALGLLTGVAELIAFRTVAEEAADPARLRSDLLRWVESYRLRPGIAPLPQRCWRQLGAAAPSPPPRLAATPPLLPRGRTALPPADAAAARRQRLLDATARLAAADGYGALSVARIAAAARVPRAAFYSHFECKREVLMAAQTHAMQEAMAAAAAEYSLAVAWPQRIAKAGEAFLSYVASRSDYACLDFLESYAAGPAAIRHRQRNHMVFALFVEEGYRQTEDASHLPQLASEAIASAVFGMMRDLILAGRCGRMLSVLPAGVYTILGPFIGPEEALSEARRLAPGAR